MGLEGTSAISRCRAVAASQVSMKRITAELLFRCYLLGLFNAVHAFVASLITSSLPLLSTFVTAKYLAAVKMVS
jgi:hypothetical protein